MLLQEYQVNWPKDFAEIKKILIDANQGIKIDIEHVGSTSVPELPAKPIIDMDIIFYEVSDFEKIKSRLETLGYYHNGDQGIEGREVFKRRANNDHQVIDTIRHHLYVCHHQSRELKKHLLFRDYLRNNPNARSRYAKIKYELAEKAYQDKNIYALLKEQGVNDFINKCIKKQESKHGK